MTFFFTTTTSCCVATVQGGKNALYTQTHKSAPDYDSYLQQMSAVTSLRVSECLLMTQETLDNGSVTDADITQQDPLPTATTVTAALIVRPDSFHAQIMAEHTHKHNKGIFFLQGQVANCL